MKLFFPQWKNSASIINFFYHKKSNYKLKKLYMCSIKKNQELNVLINNNKFVDFNKKFSQKIKIKMLFLRNKKVKYLFQFKIRFLKF